MEKTRRASPIPTGVREFKVIQADTIHPDDRAKVMTALAEFKTAAQARQGASSKGFAVETVDPRGRVILLKWKGADVALLFQRTVATISVTPVETAPAVWLNNLDEAWMMIPLMGFRHDQQVSALQDRVKDSEQSGKNLQGLFAQSALIAEQQRQLLDKQEKDLAEVVDERDRYKKACEGYEKTGKGILVKWKTRTKQIVKTDVRYKTEKEQLTPHQIVTRVADDKTLRDKLIAKLCDMGVVLYPPKLRKKATQKPKAKSVTKKSKPKARRKK